MNDNHINSNEDYMEKIDEESLHNNDSYIRQDSSINKSFENNFQKNQDDNPEDNKDEENGMKENEQKNDLIIDEEENNISKNEEIIGNPQGMKENNDQKEFYIKSFFNPFIFITFLILFIKI